jgi:hypothetical protein
VPIATLPACAGSRERALRACPKSLAVSPGKRNCELFQAFIRASVNDHGMQTYCTLSDELTKALLLGFM